MMWLKIAIVALLSTAAVLADKPSSPVVAGAKKGVATAKAVPVVPTVKVGKASAKTVETSTPDKKAEKEQKADDRSDIVAAETSYSAAKPASTGNLYYYYYPVAAYPIHANEKVSSTSASSSSSGNVLDSPIVYIGIPLVLLAIAAGIISLFFTSTTTVASGRSFQQSYRDSSLDEKFGSFAELQAEIDHQLSKYMTALDSENCMDRIVCELGTKASGIPQKDLFFSIVEWLVSPKHQVLGFGRMTILKDAALGKYTMDTCKKFICNPPASIQEHPKN